MDSLICIADFRKFIVDCFSRLILFFLCNFEFSNLPISTWDHVFDENAIKRESFKCLTEIRNRRLQQEALQHLIQLLPTPNRETLWALLNFLSVVASNSEDQKSETGEWIPGNKMDTTNLATVSTACADTFRF